MIKKKQNTFGIVFQNAMPSAVFSRRIWMHSQILMMLASGFLENDEVFMEKSNFLWRYSSRRKIPGQKPGRNMHICMQNPLLICSFVFYLFKFISQTIILFSWDFQKYQSYTNASFRWDAFYQSLTGRAQLEGVRLE